MTTNSEAGTGADGALVLTAPPSVYTTPKHPSLKPLLPPPLHCRELAFGRESACSPGSSPWKEATFPFYQRAPLGY